MSIAYSTGLDLLILAILVVSIVLGVRRGLIRSVIRLVGSLVALILALIFSAQLGVYIDAHYVNTPMREWLVQRLTLSESAEKAEPADVDFDDLFENQPEFFRDTCEFLNIDPAEMAAKYTQMKAEGIEQARSAIVTAMVDPISAVISRVIAFAVIFIAAMILILVISLFSRFLNNLPVVRKMDKLGGGLLGAVTGILLCFILVSVISTGSKYFLRDSDAQDREAIREKTVLYRVFYQTDPLKYLFEKK